MAHRAGQLEPVVKDKIGRWIFRITVAFVAFATGVVALFVWAPWRDDGKTARAAAQEKLFWSLSNRIVASPGKWSNSIPLRGKWKITPVLGEKAEVLFSDGRHRTADSFEQIDGEFAGFQGSAQFRGVDREVVVYIFNAERR